MDVFSFHGASNINSNSYSENLSFSLDQFFRYRKGYEYPVCVFYFNTACWLTGYKLGKVIMESIDVGGSQNTKMKLF